MFPAASEAEMAETLLVVSGDNAGNAARHFAKRYYDTGDVASALVWGHIASAADAFVSRRAQGPAAAPPEPQRMRNRGATPPAAAAVDARREAAIFHLRPSARAQGTANPAPARAAA
jgi:hypothetical protein